MRTKIKICLISSSGGHYEQLKMLKKLEEKYDVFWVTEQTKFKSQADYYLLQTGLKDKKYPFKMAMNFFKSLKIWYIEKPDLIITTGTMVALPLAIISKVFRKKVIYIETFARINDGTKSGKLMYKIVDLFIIQWETLKDIYPEAVFGGSIY
ncbi:PssD/Cps14F family polysaccharide biosynthesis glycosyltransferase [Fundicoccus sp. Sow4_F4]|uniref:PssD/Cps14F family polysaccharide biosynthesis glycosyltransferase n=1 Tax=Fundicoccus sp. Sow4_F4 TaxID=3438783 RepID=UPI003F8EAEC4